MCLYTMVSVVECTAEEDGKSSIHSFVVFPIVQKAERRIVGAFLSLFKAEQFDR